MEMLSMKRVNLFLVIASVLLFGQAGVAQEKFNDVRQQMADSLTAVKTSLRADERAAAMEHFGNAKKIWETEARPMITEGMKTNNQFQEYFDRIAEVDGHFISLAQELESGGFEQIESRVNAVIWAISHHPRGFKVPNPRYTAWDWVFGLGIGIGFCVFAVVFGLHLRRSYYRRYKKQGAEAPQG